MERAPGTSRPPKRAASAGKGARKPAAAASRPAKLRLADLGWTRDQARKVREELASFEEDWSAPGMDAYDKL